MRCQWWRIIIGKRCKIRVLSHPFFVLFARRTVADVVLDIVEAAIGRDHPAVVGRSSSSNLVLAVDSGAPHSMVSRVQACLWVEATSVWQGVMIKDGINGNNSTNGENPSLSSN